MFYKEECDQQKDKKWNDFAEKPESGIIVNQEDIYSDAGQFGVLEINIDQIIEANQKDNNKALYDALLNVHQTLHKSPPPYLLLFIENQLVTRLMDLLQPSKEEISYVTLLVLCDLSCGDNFYEEEMVELGLINAAKEYLRIPRGRKNGIDLDKVFILLLSNVLIDCKSVDIFDSEIVHYVLSATFRSTSDQVVYYITKFIVVYLNRVSAAPVDIRTDVLSLVRYNARMKHPLIFDYTLRLLTILMKKCYIDDESIDPAVIEKIFEDVENVDTVSFFACVEVASRNFPIIYEHTKVSSSIIMNKFDSECMDDDNFEMNALCLVVLSNIVLYKDKEISDQQIELINDLLNRGNDLRFDFKIEIVQFAAIVFQFITQEQFNNFSRLSAITYIRDYLESNPIGMHQQHFDNVLRGLYRFSLLKSNQKINDGEVDEIFEEAVHLALESIYQYPKTEGATKFVEKFDVEDKV